MRDLKEKRKFNGNLMVNTDVVDEPLQWKIDEGKALLKDHIERGVDPNSDIVTDVRKVILELQMGTVKWDREHDRRHLKAYLRGDKWFKHGKNVKGEDNWFEV